MSDENCCADGKCTCGSAGEEMGNIGVERGDDKEAADSGLKATYDKLKEVAEEGAATADMLVIFGVVNSKTGSQAGEIVMKKDADMSPLIFMLENILKSLTQPVDGTC